MTALAGIAVAAALGYALLVLAAWGLQDYLVFPAGGSLWRTPEDAGWTYQDVSLPVAGETTHGWYVEAPDARGVVHFSHGNGGTIANRLESVAIFRDLGFDVLLYDYGGYGISTGRPSEARCHADARAMWAYLVDERGWAPGQVVVFGRSLGGAVAANLAAEVKPAGVILESTFLSVAQVARESFPFLPIGLILRHRLDTTEVIRDIAAPVLVVHSRQDEIIGFAHGEELFELANEPKTFLEIEGRHNTGYLNSGDVYVDGLRRFLDMLFEGRPGTG